MTAGRINYREKARKELITWEKSLREDFRSKVCDLFDLPKDNEDINFIIDEMWIGKMWDISNSIDQSL